MKLLIPVLLLCGSALGQTKAKAQIILDPVQAKYPGNEHAKECSVSNNDSACFDPKLEHYVIHQYLNKNTCEVMEKAVCIPLSGLLVETEVFAPVDKPFITTK